MEWDSLTVLAWECLGYETQWGEWSSKGDREVTASVSGQRHIPKSHSFCFRTTAHPHQAAWGGLWAAGNVKVWGKAWILEGTSYSLSAQHAGDSDFFSWTTMRADTALHLFSFIFLCAWPWVRATEVISALLAFSTVASRNVIKSGAEMPNTWLTKEMLLL